MFKEIFNNFLKMFKQGDDSHEFKPILTEIEDRPLNPLGRVIFWLIVALMVFTTLWLCIGKVDVVVSAQAKAIPDGNIKVIQPLDIGVIDSILVKEGEHVTRDQLLVQINPSSVDPALDSTKKTLVQIQEEIARLQAAVSGKAYSGDDKTQNSLLRASNTALQSQIGAKNAELQRVSAEIENNDYLLKQATDKKARQEQVLDIISREEYERTLSEISRYSNRVKELNQQKKAINNEITHISSSDKKDNLLEIQQREKELNELKAKVEEVEFKSTQQRITSPVDGYVTTLLVSTVGGVVTPAQQLMSIVPDDTPLIVKATVLNKDIGFVKEGMETSLKIETFNFQKYGLLKGVVKNISKDSIMDEKLGPVYEVFIVPEDKVLMVEGREERLTPGMTVTAEINIGKRRIIEFFIYPMIRYLKESVSVR